MNQTSIGTWLPWLHPHRADVLAALALAMRMRQPLASGFTRLAESDPWLQPWAARLSPDLASGAPLGRVLRKHRLLDRQAAQRLDAAVDPVGEFEHLSQEQLVPVQGLTLIRWFPVYLVGVMLGPLAVTQAIGVAHLFESMYRELGIKLPEITVLIFRFEAIWLVVWGLAIGVMWGVIFVLLHIRFLRHVCHLWWVDVHRQAALYALTCAAVQQQDEPQRLRWLAWLAALRISADRQLHPAWDRDWRTWRILTRFRALGPGWKSAARSSTAAEVLVAMGFLPPHAENSVLLHARDEARQRLLTALEPARTQAFAVLMLGVAIGAMLVVLALFMPLITVVQIMGSN